MKNAFLYILIFIAFFLPGIVFRTAIPSIYLHNILLVALFLWMILSGRYRFGELLYAPSFRLFSIPFSILLFYNLLLTLLLLPTVSESQYIAYNIIGAFGKFRPFLMAVVLFALIRSPVTARKLATFLLVILYMEIVLMVFQSQNLFNVNGWLSPLYRGRELRTFMARGDRVFGTMGNVNTMGTLLSILGTMAYARLIYGPGKIVRLLAGLGAGLSLVCCIWLSRSRQGTICLLAGIFFVQLISMVRSGKRGWSVVVFIIAGLGLVGLFVTLGENQELAERFGVLSGKTALTEEGSFSVRIQTLPLFWEVNGPWLAIGQGDGIKPYFWDSGYMDTLEKVGLLGLLMLFLMHIWPAIRSWRIMKKTPRHIDSWLYCTGFSLCPILLLVPVVNSTWVAPRTMTTVCIVYAIVLRALYFSNVTSSENESIVSGESLQTSCTGAGVYCPPLTSEPMRGPWVNWRA
jgi:hypothetical protein